MTNLTTCKDFLVGTAVAILSLGFASALITLGCQPQEPERIVETVVVERAVEVVKEVEVEVPVERVVEVVKEVEVEVPVERVVEVVKEVEVEVPVERVVEVIKEVEVEVEVPVEVVKEVIVTVPAVSTTEVGTSPTSAPIDLTTSADIPVPAATPPVIPTAALEPTMPPDVPPTPTPAPLTEISFAGVTTSTNSPSQVQVVFALRDQNGHAVVVPAERVEEGIRVYEDGPGTDGWDEIDYSETSFFVHSAENIDLEVVFVLDFTNSMYEARLPDGRTGIDAMLEAFDAALAVLPSAHRIGVVEFHDRNVPPSVLASLTTDRAALRASVFRFAASGFDHGSSRVWDGVQQGMRLFSSLDANSRAVRALVFLSDGRDTSSFIQRDSLSAIARELHAQLYALGIGDVYQSDLLRDVVEGTGGAYYEAADVSLLQAQLQQLVNDLRGQYQLSYITLRRTGSYRVGITFNRNGLSADAVVGPFDVASFFGPDNEGIVSYDPPSLDRDSGIATVFVRALHMPRNINRIRFNPGTVKPVQVNLVPETDGGLLEGWTLDGPDGSGYYEVSSPSPIEFGDLGLLFKLTYSEISERRLWSEWAFDNTIYEGGKRLVADIGIINIGEPFLIAFHSDRDGDHEIYVMNADGTGVVQLTRNSASDGYPNWSPDGDRIAFHSDRDGDREIFVMNADGTGVVQLTRNSASDGRPNWSPDGGRIAFASDRDGDFEIYVMNADGTGVAQLTRNSASDDNARWSPNGGRIAFASDRDGDREIYVMNADGTGAVQLTHNSASDGIPNWSPDGSRFTFNSYRVGNDGEIYVMYADGTGAVPLTDNRNYDGGSIWSPDGGRIAFASDRDGDREIYVMDADGTGVVQLTRNSARDEFPNWSP